MRIMNNEAQQIILALQLISHPEGGFFRETYRAGETCATSSDARRNYSTAIYYLLAEEQISHLHRIKSDEIWHFYRGCSVTIHCLDPAAGYKKLSVGMELAAGAYPQVIIPKNTWFAAELADKSAYALCGCTVSPGFDFADFELGDRTKLCAEFPGQVDLIERFTKKL